MGGRAFDFAPYRVFVKDSGCFVISADDLPLSIGGEDVSTLMCGPATDLNLPPEVAGPDAVVFGDCYDRMPNLMDPRVAAHLKWFIAWHAWNLRALHTDAHDRLARASCRQTGPGVTRSAAPPPHGRRQQTHTSASEMTSPASEPGDTTSSSRPDTSSRYSPPSSRRQSSVRRRPSTIQ